MKDVSSASHLQFNGIHVDAVFNSIVGTRSLMFGVVIVMQRVVESLDAILRSK